MRRLRARAVGARRPRAARHRGRRLVRRRTRVASRSATRPRVGIRSIRRRSSCVMPLHNRTRTTASIPRKLLREGKLHLLPVYALMRISDLAREGIENSGSFRFADHVYRNEASGRFGIGRALDALLLRMRGARSMRNRFYHVQREMLAAARAIEARRADGQLDDMQLTLRILSVPCGIARDLVTVGERLDTDFPEVRARTT